MTAGTRRSPTTSTHASGTRRSRRSPRSGPRRAPPGKRPGRPTQATSSSRSGGARPRRTASPRLPARSPGGSRRTATARHLRTSTRTRSAAASGPDSRRRRRSTTGPRRSLRRGCIRSKVTGSPRVRSGPHWRRHVVGRRRDQGDQERSRLARDACQPRRDRQDGSHVGTQRQRREGCRARVGRRNATPPVHREARRRAGGSPRPADAAFSIAAAIEALCGSTPKKVEFGNPSAISTVEWPWPQPMSATFAPRSRRSTTPSRAGSHCGTSAAL